MKKNKVKFGCSNVHIAPITETDETGKPTYLPWIHVPGTVNINMQPTGDSTPFYADNVTYYMTDTNDGYDGEFENAYIPEEIQKAILQFLEDKNGVIYEHVDQESREFAMAWEFVGNERDIRYLFYRCKMQRPNITGTTKQQSVEPQTDQLSFKAMPRLDTKIVKAQVLEGSAAYDDWYKKVYEIEPGDPEPPAGGGESGGEDSEPASS